MEFWGVDVKSGESLKVSPGEGMVLHLSQACIGEIKKEKGSESVCLFVNIDGKKLVLGTLFTDKLPQQQFDLVFEKDFEISHNWKSGSVYFYGYKATHPLEDEDEFPGDSDESEEEDILNALAANGNAVQISKKEKPAEAAKVNAAKDKDSKAGKQKVKIVEPPKDANPEEGDDSSDDDLMSEDDDDSEDEDDSDDSDDDDESDESDETPKKVETSKKRPAESASKTPISDKKAKITPHKNDGQKGGHVATPYPGKQAGKTPANKPNQQTPKSGGSHSCKPCNRTFGSEKALESHSKAKHGN